MLIPDTILSEGHVWESHRLRMLCLGTFIPHPSYHVLVVYRMDDDDDSTIHSLLYDAESGDVVKAYPHIQMPNTDWRQHQEISVIEVAVRRACASPHGPALKSATRTAFLDALLGCTSAAWRAWRGMESPDPPLTTSEWELMLEPASRKTTKQKSPARRKNTGKGKEKEEDKEKEEYDMVCIGPGMMRVRKSTARAAQADQDSALMRSVFRLSQSARR